MGNFADTGPVRLPPTQPPKRRRVRPRWVAPVAVVLTVALTAVGVSAVLNNEVSRRLATVPPSSIVTTTTTIPTVATTPVVAPEVMAARARRPSPPAPPSTTTTSPPVESTVVFEAETPSELIASLERLPVEEEHPEGYARTQYGFYKDADEDGCNTRAEVAITEAIEVKVNPRNCGIESGRWLSLFDGKTLTAVGDLDVTHLVALREAWESGAWEWDRKTRNAYLNDLKHAETLIGVSDESEDARDDKDPGGWLPSNDAFLCDYLRNWVYIKTIYKLSVDAGEREAIAAAALYC